MIYGRYFMKFITKIILSSVLVAAAFTANASMCPSEIYCTQENPLKCTGTGGIQGGSWYFSDGFGDPLNIRILFSGVGGHRPNPNNNNINQVDCLYSTNRGGEYIDITYMVHGNWTVQVPPWVTTVYPNQLFCQGSKGVPEKCPF